jgi:hypothetical protein
MTKIKNKAKHSAKNALLRKIVKTKAKNPTGASPLKAFDSGLGKTPLTTPNLTGGAGSNLGTNRVF